MGDKTGVKIGNNAETSNGAEKSDKVSLYMKREDFYTNERRRKSLMKRSTKIMYRVNSRWAGIIEHTFSEVRKKCDNPSLSNSKINRAFWMALHRDTALRARVMEAVCKFLDENDMSA